MFGDIGAMMKMAKEMQGKMQELQTSLQALRVTGESGAGMVRVTMNGKHEVIAVEIAEEAMGDREMLQGLVHAATNDAVRRVAEEIKARMNEITGGLPLPGLPGML
ncbi:MAG TPA: YbaB/EbfC family nucleoid-associated protein [Spirochaetota bacterium]|nr:YbaB/EbfC family nucleoid-associated protein [Spirochaetota bacterium]